MELARIVLAISDLSLVCIITTPGFIGSEGRITREATSKFAFIISKKRIIMYHKKSIIRLGLTGGRPSRM